MSSLGTRTAKLQLLPGEAEAPACAQVHSEKQHGVFRQFDPECADRSGETAKKRACDPSGSACATCYLANTPAATQANSMARCRASVCAAHGARGCEGEEVAEENAPRAAASLGATRADFSPGFAADDAAYGDADEDYAAARAYASDDAAPSYDDYFGASSDEYGFADDRRAARGRSREGDYGGAMDRYEGDAYEAEYADADEFDYAALYAAAYGDYRGAATRSNANANANANARLGFPGRRGTARAMARPAPFAPRRAGPGARGGVARARGGGSSLSRGADARGRGRGGAGAWGRARGRRGGGGGGGGGGGFRFDVDGGDGYDAGSNPRGVGGGNAAASPFKVGRCLPQRGDTARGRFLFEDDSCLEKDSGGDPLGCATVEGTSCRFCTTREGGGEEEVFRTCPRDVCDVHGLRWALCDAT